MIEFLEKQLEGQKEKLESHYTERGNASPESVGSYANLIQNTIAEIKRLELDISIQKKASTPNEINIYCFVLVSTLDKIKHNLDDACHCHLEDGRYHKTDCNQWKPFQNEDCIAAILDEYKKSYPIKISYLDGEVDDDLLLVIDDNLEHSIAIIDVFSLDEQNKQTATIFDSNKTAGLITPICRTLHKDLFTHADKMGYHFKRLNARVNKSLPNLYIFDVGLLRSFKANLTNILSAKFTITNQSTAQSDVRGFNFNLS